MKMIPKPEAGDKVILKPDPGDGKSVPPLPELTTKVVYDEDSPVYDKDEDNWQIAVEAAPGGDGEEEMNWRVTWDEIAQAWRDQ